MRYLLLVILNSPIIILAFLNIITQYKLNRISKKRFYRQILMWGVILAAILGAFPIYNLTIGRPALSSFSLSIFDIAEITAIIFIFYIVNNQIRKLNNTERRLRELHQELSIKLSEIKNEKN